jgi:hypothetical protein
MYFITYNNEVFDFLIYKKVDYNMLSYLYYNNFEKNINVKTLNRDIGLDHNIFNFYNINDKIVRTADKLRMRFFRFFKHIYNIDMIQQQVNKLNVIVDDKIYEFEYK